MADDEEVYWCRREIDDLYEDIGWLVFYLNISIAINITVALVLIGGLIYWAAV
jgi:hypothetical protein